MDKLKCFTRTALAKRQTNIDGLMSASLRLQKAYQKEKEKTS